MTILFDALNPWALVLLLSVTERHGMEELTSLAQMTRFAAPDVAVPTVAALLAALAGHRLIGWP